MRRLFHFTVLTAALTGCATEKLAFTPISLAPLPGAQADEHKSSLNAAAFGVVSVSGSVSRMKGEAQYLDSITSRNLNDSVSTRGSRTGDEGNRGCGQLFSNSYAESVSAFSVQNNLTTRSYGFTLNTSVSARGGYNKGILGIDVPLVGNLGINVPYLGNLNVCTKSTETDGKATASAEGRLDINYRAIGNEHDRLIVRLLGNADSASLQLLNSQGKAMALGQVRIPGILSVELPAPGPYTLLARVDNSQSGHGANSPLSASIKTLTVSIQSQRDALALGYDEPLASSQSVALPLFIPRADVEAEIKKALFTDQGRFYPCRNGVECDRYGRNAYLYNPRLAFKAGYAVLRMDLAGHGEFWKLRPGVSGSIEVAGIPRLVNNKLYLVNLTMETQSRNALVNFISERFGDLALQKLQQVASYDLSPKIQEAITSANQKFPMRVGPACLSLKIDTLRFNQPQVVADGLKTQAGIDMSETDPKACGI